LLSFFGSGCAVVVVVEMAETGSGEGVCLPLGGVRNGFAPGNGSAFFAAFFLTGENGFLVSVVEDEATGRAFASIAATVGGWRFARGGVLGGSNGLVASLVVSLVSFLNNLYFSAITR